MGVAKGKGEVRLRLLQIHQLLEFEKAFTAYLAGKGSTELVQVKARGSGALFHAVGRG